MGEVVCLEASPAVRSWKMTSEDDTSSACSGRGSKVRELRVLKQQMSRAPPLSLSSKSDLHTREAEIPILTQLLLVLWPNRTRLVLPITWAEHLARRLKSAEKSTHPSHSSKSPVSPLSSLESASEWEENQHPSEGALWASCVLCSIKRLR